MQFYAPVVLCMCVDLFPFSCLGGWESRICDQTWILPKGALFVFETAVVRITYMVDIMSIFHSELIQVIWVNQERKQADKLISFQVRHRPNEDNQFILHRLQIMLVLLLIIERFARWFHGTACSFIQIPHLQLMFDFDLFDFLACCNQIAKMHLLVVPEVFDKEVW